MAVQHIFKWDADVIEVDVAIIYHAETTVGFGPECADCYARKGFMGCGGTERDNKEMGTMGFVFGWV